MIARVHVGGDLRALTFHGPRSWLDGEWHYVDRCGQKIALCRKDEFFSDFDRQGYFGHEIPGSFD